MKFARFVALFALCCFITATAQSVCDETGCNPPCIWQNTGLFFAALAVCSDNSEYFITGQYQMDCNGSLRIHVNLPVAYTGCSTLYSSCCARDGAALVPEYIYIPIE